MDGMGCLDLLFERGGEGFFSFFFLAKSGFY